MSNYKTSILQESTLCLEASWARGPCPGANSSMLALWASRAGPSEMQGVNGQRAKLNFHHCKSHAWELKGAFGIKERCLRGLLPISSGPSSSVRWTLQDSPQPAGNLQSVVPGFLLPCLLSGHWPWGGCHHRRVQPSSPQMWAWLTFLQSKGSTQRGTWEMENVLTKQGSSHFSKIPRLLIDFLCFWWSRVSCLVQNGRSCKWCFKNCPWQDEKLVTLCWSLKLRKKEN